MFFKFCPDISFPKVIKSVTEMFQVMAASDVLDLVVTMCRQPRLGLELIRFCKNKIFVSFVWLTQRATSARFVSNQLY